MTQCIAVKVRGKLKRALAGGGYLGGKRHGSPRKQYCARVRDRSRGGPVRLQVKGLAKVDKFSLWSRFKTMDGGRGVKKSVGRVGGMEEERRK